MMNNELRYNRDDDDRQIMTEAVMRHSRRMQGWMRLEVFQNDREKNGWLEWMLVYEFWSGGKLTVGLIQRKPGEPVESHT